MFPLFTSPLGTIKVGLNSMSDSLMISKSVSNQNIEFNYLDTLFKKEKRKEKNEKWEMKNEKRRNLLKFDS